jgi:hypothetical protein
VIQHNREMIIYYLKELSALIAARALFIRLVEPYLFASTSVYPATMSTLRIDPQAMSPVPFEAG